MKIPYLNIPDKPLIASTQDHLPIADIAKKMVLFKNGGAAIVMESTALNFGLLSEKEQEAVIAAYSALLNSLNFSIQIVVKSKQKNIANYMEYLDEEHEKIKNEKLYNMMSGYKKFIAETIKKKNVLEKKFYLVIPLSPLELGVAQSFAAFKKRKGPLPFSRSYIVKRARLVLEPRRDHLMRQAGRLGLKLRQLTEKELIELYYTTYNSDEPVDVKEEIDE